MVCHLKRALYGLRQAPRAWNQRLKSELQAYDFTESNADPGLYIHDTPSGKPAYILVYVDDLLIAARDLNAVTTIKSKIMSSFEARDLGEANTFLGMNITRDRTNRTLKLGGTSKGSQPWTSTSNRARSCSSGLRGGSGGRACARFMWRRAPRWRGSRPTNKRTLCARG